jgi:guanylate kinase
MTNSGAVTINFNPLSRRGGLICIIGPSGSGKSSIIKELCRREPTLIESLSTTTRAARPGEQHGTDYNFITTETFNVLAERGAFLQHVTYNGVSYGTLRQPVEQAM